MPDAPDSGGGSSRSPRPPTPPSAADPPAPAPRRGRGGRGGSDPTELSALGRLIDGARRERGLTLLQLAARLGVPRQFLYRLLRSQVPCDAPLRARLRAVLGVELPPDEAS